MKFIHLTDTHVIKTGARLYGGDPAATLRAAVASINAEHGDAEFVVVTGDLTHWGDPAAYHAFAEAIAGLAMPVHLMVGNHDVTSALFARFPDLQRDPNGFVQYTFDTDQGRCILLDTRAEGTHAGAFCKRRQTWLGTELAATTGPIMLFMHHPPFPVGIRAMDAIMLQDADAFHDTIAPHKSRIRHLFFGHLHRPVFGTWKGVSFSCMRGLNHQVALDLGGDPASILGNFENPAYGVVIVNSDSLVVHMHDFHAASAPFSLSPPFEGNGRDYALSFGEKGMWDGKKAHQPSRPD